ncbi:MAG TPA: hypothetical protein VN428_10465 [Bryobacteraceae bacterium]|nr:hypothetical protein [Bryobacteraceae bacterium]
MARGWESKSVESQIDSAASQRAKARTKQLTPEEITRASARHSLELSRTRVMHDLESATHERYREMLKKALAHIDGELAKLA